MGSNFPGLWVTMDTDGPVKCLTWTDLDDISKGGFNQRGSQVEKEDKIQLSRPRLSEYSYWGL